MISEERIKELDKGEILLVEEKEVEELRNLGFVVKVEEDREPGSRQLNGYDYYAAAPWFVKGKPNWN